MHLVDFLSMPYKRISFSFQNMNLGSQVIIYTQIIFLYRKKNTSKSTGDNESTGPFTVRAMGGETQTVIHQRLTDQGQSSQ